MYWRFHHVDWWLVSLSLRIEHGLRFAIAKKVHCWSDVMESSGGGVQAWERLAVVHDFCCALGLRSDAVFKECWPGCPVSSTKAMATNESQTNTRGLVDVIDTVDGLRGLYCPEHCCLRPFIAIDFAIIGFPKCGTETVANLLKLHPEVGMTHYQRSIEGNIATISAGEDAGLAGVEDILTPSQVLHYNFLVRNLPGRTKGLKHVWTVYDTRKIWRLGQIPKLQVILMIREPVAWFESLFEFFLKDCYDGGRGHLCCKIDTQSLGGGAACPLASIPSPAAVVAGNASFGLPNLHLHHAHFSRFLQQIFSVFSDDEVLLLDVDALSETPDAATEALTAFLRLPPFAKESLSSMRGSRWNTNEKKGRFRQSLRLCRRSRRPLLRKLARQLEPERLGLLARLRSQGARGPPISRALSLGYEAVNCVTK